MTGYSKFGLVVKTKLLEKGKTQKWLASAVAQKTGLFVDSAYIYKILTGQRNAPKVVAVICDVLDIPEKGLTEKTEED